MSKYQTCGWMFYLEYVLKQKPPFVRNEALDVGSVADNLMEQSIKVGIPAAFIAYDINKEEILKKYKYAEPFFDKIKIMVENAYNRLAGLGFSNDLPHFFQKKIDLDWFVGYIDFYFVSKKGKVIVLDWKTSSYPYKEHQIIQSDQLKTYCYFLTLEGINPTHYGYVVMDKKTLSATRHVVGFTKADFDYIEEKFKGIKYAIDSGVFIKNESGCDNYYGNRCYHYATCWGIKKIYTESSIDLPVFNLKME